MARNFFKIFEGISLVPRSVDPTTPADGDLQFSDGTARDKGLWQYLDGAWAQFGGGGFDIQTISSTQTLVSGVTYLVDTTSNSPALTLPAAALNAFVTIKDSVGNSTNNPINVLTPGAETIDGEASLQFGNDFVSITLVSDGTNWFKI